MKQISIPNKSIALVLTERQAEALWNRLLQHTGIRKSKALIRAELKLGTAIDKI